MDEKLIDRGECYEIKDYKPIVKLDDEGNVLFVINCPYILKFIMGIDNPLVAKDSR